MKKKMISLLLAMICVLMLCGCEDAAVQPETDEQTTPAVLDGSLTNSVENGVFTLTPDAFMRVLTQRVELNFGKASYQWVESMNSFFRAELTYGSDRLAFLTFHHPETLKMFSEGEINDTGVFCISAYFLSPVENSESISPGEDESYLCADDFIYCCDTSLTQDEIDLIEAIAEICYEKALPSDGGTAHFNNMCYDYLWVPEKLMKEIGYSGYEAFSFTVNPVVFTHATNPVEVAYDYSPKYFCDFLFELENAVLDKYTYTIETTNDDLICVFEPEESAGTYATYGVISFYSDDYVALGEESMEEVGRLSNIMLEIPESMGDMIPVFLFSVDPTLTADERDIIMGTMAQGIQESPDQYIAFQYGDLTFEFALAHKDQEPFYKLAIAVN